MIPDQIEEWVLLSSGVVADADWNVEFEQELEEWEVEEVLVDGHSQPVPLPLLATPSRTAHWDWRPSFVDSDTSPPPPDYVDSDYLLSPPLPPAYDWDWDYIDVPRSRAASFSTSSSSGVPPSSLRLPSDLPPVLPEKAYTLSDDAMTLSSEGPHPHESCDSNDGSIDESMDEDSWTGMYAYASQPQRWTQRRRWNFHFYEDGCVRPTKRARNHSPSQESIKAGPEPQDDKIKTERVPLTIRVVRQDNDADDVINCLVPLHVPRASSAPPAYSAAPPSQPIMSFTNRQMNTWKPRRAAFCQRD